AVVAEVDDLRPLPLEEAPHDVDRGVVPGEEGGCGDDAHAARGGGAVHGLSLRRPEVSGKRGISRLFPRASSRASRPAPRSLTSRRVARPSRVRACTRVSVAPPRRGLTDTRLTSPGI